VLGSTQTNLVVAVDDFVFEVGYLIFEQHFVVFGIESIADRSRQSSAGIEQASDVRPPGGVQERLLEVSVHHFLRIVPSVARVSSADELAFRVEFYSQEILGLVHLPKREDVFVWSSGPSFRIHFHPELDCELSMAGVGTSAEAEIVSPGFDEGVLAVESSCFVMLIDASDSIEPLWAPVLDEAFKLVLSKFCVSILSQSVPQLLPNLRLQNLAASTGVRDL